MHLHASIFEAPQPSQDLKAPSSRLDPLGPTDPPDAPAPRRIADRSLGRSRGFGPCLGLYCFSLVSLLACAPRSPLPFWPSEPELVEVEDPGPGRLFVKPDHSLYRYDEVLLQDVGLHYGPNQRRIALEDEQRILAMLVAAIEGSRDRAVARASHPGPCVLAVDYFLTYLELAAEPPRPTGSTDIRRSLGSAALVLELRDSQSDELLARFAERRSLGGGRWLGGRREQLDRVESVIGQAIYDLGGKLDRLAPPEQAAFAAAERDERCHGTILRVAHGAR
jgi:hypothetical protein